MTQPVNVTWRLGVLFLAVGGLIYLWFPIVAHLSNLIWTVDTYSHSLLVPFISLALIWARRDRIEASTLKTDALGLLALVAGAFLWFVGEVVEVKLLGHLGLITSLLALVLALLGRHFFKTFLFPLLFLYVLVPVGHSIIPALQTLTAEMVILALPVFGVEFEAEGVLLTLPSGMYEVARACAGIKFLFASAVTGILLAHLAYESWKGRIAIFLVSLALPILANALRVLGILLIAEATDQSFAKGVDHLVYGWGFLSFVLLLLIAIAYRFSDRSEKQEIMPDQTVARPEGREDTYLFALRTIMAFAIVAIATHLAPGSTAEVRPIRAIIPPECDDCDIRKLDTSPDKAISFWLGADQEFMTRYRAGADTITVSGALYCPQRQGHRLVQAGNAPAGQGWSILPGTGGEVLKVAEWVLEKRVYWKQQYRRVVYISYYVGGQPVTSERAVKIETALQRLKQGAADGAALVLSASQDSGFIKDEDKLQSFLSTFSPDSFLWDGLVPQNEGPSVCVG